MVVLIAVNVYEKKKIRIRAIRQRIYARRMALLSLATLQLVKILLANNKNQDIDKIYNDIQYRNKLMEEYKIVSDLVI